MANLYKRHQLMGMRPITPKPRPFERDLVNSLVQNGLVDIVRLRRLPILAQPAGGERHSKNGSQWTNAYETSSNFPNGFESMTHSSKNGSDKRFPINRNRNGTGHRSSHVEASVGSEEPIRQQLDGQDHEWKLEHRPIPDPRPIPAPVDTDSQSNEGFKRFYMAVVSPTHVRVTAGGRIVPNPRGSSSPAGRANDRPGGDTPSLTVPHAGSQVLSTNVGTAGGSSQANQGSVPAGFPDMMAASMPMGSVPMMPFPFGYPMPQMPVAPASMVSQGTNKNGDTKTDKGSAKPEKSTPAASAVVPGPNPSPFYAASAQPFMPGMPLSMPMPMMTPHSGIPAFSTGAMAPMMPQMPFTPVFGPMQWQGGQLPHHVPMPMQVPMPMNMSMAVPSLHGMPFPGNNPATNGQPLHAPSAPAPSSIVMSEVTRKHIENFRAQLKWINNQLQYNKHQVDETYMKHLADGIRTQLKTFKNNLKSQLEYEAKQRGQVSSKDTSVSREMSKSTSAVSDTANEADHKDTILGKREHRAKTAGFKPKPTQSMFSTDDSDKAETSVSVKDLASGTSNPSYEPMKKRSGLPITAALAPPFQPRSHTNMVVDHKPRRESLAEPERSDHAAAKKNPQIPMSTPSQTSMETTVPAMGNHSHQLEVRTTSFNYLQKLNNGLGLPYLQGKLRPGVSQRDAKDEDYIYHRQLTDDEVRARHLYWGNAPRSVQKGLPKYDGKDFYPPSPTKENSFADLATSYKSQPFMDGRAGDYQNSAGIEQKMAQISVSGFEDNSSVSSTSKGISRLPVGDLSDYHLKPQVEQRKILRAVDGNGDYGFRPTDPNDNVRTMKELLALSLTRHEQKNKRDTKSDNVNGNNLAAKDKAGTRGRPATSILSQEYSDSDQTSGSNAIAPSFQSPLPSTQSQSTQSDDAEESREKILFKGRQNMTRNSRHSGAMTFVKKPTSGACALPGAMSSTTAHGLLPHYAGSAAASLSPSAGNSSPSSSAMRASGLKTAEGGRQELGSKGASKEAKDENKPLHDEA
ncbi:hypothetical protein EV126DRAFT_141060 [Verticillium dahliae]|nr:hypothetical protein EV126DRAFT_141060 [Verticillium dahliae]